MPIDEVILFLKHVPGDQLFAPMLLLLLDLRPAGVCGLRRSGVDLEARVISVETTRTNVERTVVEKATKSKVGKRKLPLPKAVSIALKSFRATQAADKSTAGDGYEISDAWSSTSSAARSRRIGCAGAVTSSARLSRSCAATG